RGNEHATIVPYETFEASDGWINLGVANDDIWRRFCAAAGVAELADDPRFATAPNRVQNRDGLKRLDDSGVPCGAIRTVAEVCDSEVLALKVKRAATASYIETWTRCPCALMAVYRAARIPWAAMSPDTRSAIEVPTLCFGVVSTRPVLSKIKT